MISSSSLASSAVSADEPSMPLGLGERRTGDAVLSDLVDMEVAEGGVVVLLVQLCLDVLLGQGDVR